MYYSVLYCTTDTWRQWAGLPLSVSEGLTSCHVLIVGTLKTAMGEEYKCRYVLEF